MLILSLFKKTFVFKRLEQELKKKTEQKFCVRSQFLQRILVKIKILTLDKFYKANNPFLLRWQIDSSTEFEVGQAYTVRQKKSDRLSHLPTFSAPKEHWVKMGVVAPGYKFQKLKKEDLELRQAWALVPCPPPQDISSTC